MICIYKIINPENKIYIGATTNFKKRMSYYKSMSCKGQIKIFESLKKYGYESHKIEIICKCKKEDLEGYEIFYIKHYNTFDSENGLNMTSGGTKCKQSKETLKKRSNSLKGRVLTQEWKDKIGKKSKGRMLGFKHSEESILKMKSIKKKKWDKPHPKKGTGYNEEEKRIRHNEANKRYREKLKQLKLNNNDN